MQCFALVVCATNLWFTLESLAAPPVRANILDDCARHAGVFAIILRLETAPVTGQHLPSQQLREKNPHSRGVGGMFAGPVCLSV